MNKAHKINQELVDACIALTNALRTFSPNVPECEQGWTSYDEDALRQGFKVIEQAERCK